MKRRRSFFFPTLVVVVTLMGASGACSQHNPGAYEGGGREMPTSVVGSAGAPVEVDSSVQDTFVPPPDVGTDTFQFPDTAGQG